MWVNAQRDGRPAEYRWRPLFNAALWLTSTTRVPCSNASGLTLRLYDWSVSSEHLGFIFSFFTNLFVVVPCGRL